MTEVHPPKIELFDVAGMTNTDPKGFVRAVDRYERTDFGLYMARPLDGHRTIAYFRSWLLPAMGLRVSRWLPHTGQELDHDVYIDVVDIDDIRAGATGAMGTTVRTVDLYLDILVRDERDLRVLDTDEILAALAAGLLDDAAVQRALDRTFDAVDGIASAGYRVDAWLASKGILVTWPFP